MDRRITSQDDERDGSSRATWLSSNCRSRQAVGKGYRGYRAFLIFDDGSNVYSTYSDPVDGGYWHEPVELVNSDTMNSRLGIRDYWPSSLRVLTFNYRGRAFVYAFWSLYSTGRIAYVYSPDADSPGGPHWTQEDTFAYFPPVPGEPDPTPPPDEDVKVATKKSGREESQIYVSTWNRKVQRLLRKCTCRSRSGYRSGRECW